MKSRSLFLTALLVAAAVMLLAQNPTPQEAQKPGLASPVLIVDEKAGLAPLLPALDEIAALQDKRPLAALLAREHLYMSSFGFQFLFGVAADQDFADSSQVIAFIEAGGL